jgi:hypothetical protein
MKRLIILAVFLVATAGAATEDSPLVKAAKASGGPKKKTTKKVITNADVKKSSVKSTGVPTSAKAASPPPQVASAALPPQTIADQDKLLHDRAAAQKRTDAAQTKVKELDKELDRLEQAYYAENDPNYRDKTIVERFEQTKKQLETARKDLAESKEALEKLHR